MKRFLITHFVLWFFYTVYVVLGGSVWSGFTPGYISMIIPFVLVYSHIQVIQYSLTLYLLAYFINSKVEVKVRKKNE